MNITIIGAGHMGRAIGTIAAAAGHSVAFIDHDPENSQSAVDEVRKSASGGAKVWTTNMDETELGDMVVLAVWYGTNREVVRQLGFRLAGRTVVDIANPLNQTYDGLATPAGVSSAEEVKRDADPAAKVVKAFNTTFSGTLLAGKVSGQPLDVFIAGDDSGAKSKVAQLVKDAGMRPIDAGPLERAQALEAMQLIHIVAQGVLGTNWGSTIKILS